MKDYLHSFLDDKVEQLGDLKRGEFLYNYGTTKRIRVGMFNKAAKQDSWLNYQYASLGDYSKIG